MLIKHIRKKWLIGEYRELYTYTTSDIVEHEPTHTVLGKLMNQVVSDDSAQQGLAAIRI